MGAFSSELAGKPSVKPHAVPKEIKDISPLDVYVRVVGVVVESGSNYIVIDDGTGTARVFITGNIPAPGVGNIVRVFGSVSSNERGFIYINAEIIQDMSSLDLELYKKVKKVIKGLCV